MKWKTFMIVCGKHIQDNKYKILSESALCVDDVTNTFGVGFAVPIAVLTKRER